MINAPPAFRGNCDCGRWLIIPVGIRAARPLFCECGRSYWYNPAQEQFERKEHPIVFLDIDGVLTNLKDDDVVNPDHSCVACLNEFTNKADAVIVVSASRRKGGVEKVAKILMEWGVEGRIVDVTPDFHHDAERGAEIESWLATNKRDAFVIFDDNDDMASLTDNLVQTDYVAGLTCAHVDSALRLLGIGG